MHTIEIQAFRLGDPIGDASLLVRPSSLAVVGSISKDEWVLELVRLTQLHVWSLFDVCRRICAFHVFLLGNSVCAVGMHPGFWVFVVLGGSLHQVLSLPLSTRTAI